MEHRLTGAKAKSQEVFTRPTSRPAIHATTPHTLQPWRSGPLNQQDNPPSSGPQRSERLSDLGIRRGTVVKAPESRCTNETCDGLCCLKYFEALSETLVEAVEQSQTKYIGHQVDPAKPSHNIDIALGISEARKEVDTDYRVFGWLIKMMDLGRLKYSE
ncbi:hypothetical protein BDP55DRAFT_635521 [Colletotrichum godetiae]|uniref:Uncharacterized protein n=1 Tax=Colletotrichum godetiae TaxID=1209918 RepID=A0AAJ0AHN5_9PEZI|nr:uncharacterized protein BDP55DRAFT_635521 [Colletotrichum godetiae]KAK1671896.1 hypothetical protein BDP55DRAFT_635521 [Colletotrichum godetiae]